MVTLVLFALVDAGLEGDVRFSVAGHLFGPLDTCEPCAHHLRCLGAWRSLWGVL